MMVYECAVVVVILVLNWLRGVCAYGEADSGVRWRNCEPCPLFKNGHCKSIGAEFGRNLAKAGLIRLE